MDDPVVLWERAPAAWRRSGSSVIVVPVNAVPVKGVDDGRSEEGEREVGEVNEVIALDGLAATLWMMLSVPASAQDLHAVLSEGGVSAESLAIEDLHRIAGDLHERSLLQRHVPSAQAHASQ